MSKSWASTLRLPKSTFPPRPLPELRQKYLEQCSDSFYRWQAANRPAADSFILHDGPPYANGSLHLGHSLNKILKDMILRVKVQQGKRVTYVPGWDCHGLPIEMKAVGEAGHKTLGPTEIRRSARKLAGSTVLEQMKSFRSYAVMADWDKRWTTMDPDYEVKQLQLFQRLVHKGLIYRKYKPVYWSPSSRTALAEAELEYNEQHVSTCAYIKFPIVVDPLGLSKAGEKLFAIIWTTTPWTLPANQAIAIHDDLEYVVARAGSDLFLVAQSRLEAVQQSCFKDTAVDIVVSAIKGSSLRELQYMNRLRGKRATPQPFIHGDFVTDESGSGLVHCAPGHGFEDYQVCTRLGIPVVSPIDNDGHFTTEAYPDDPEALMGIGSVLEKEAGKKVVSLLGDLVLNVHRYRHKYPYDWRTKQPVIIRATEQWFADVDSIKGPALKSLADVKFIPESGRNRLEAFIIGRSEWCISRQRAWGVPIPALYGKDGSAIVTEDSVAHIIQVIRRRGTDAWWEDPADDPAWVAPSLQRKGEFRRGTDTMDVWFDSGSSWTQTKEQADVYLEGSDQHRGWFQSSLLTHIAAFSADGEMGQTKAPFKTVITHGFTLDQKGRKMSKSLGNIVSPDQVIDGSLMPPMKARGKKEPGTALTYDTLGPDALRLWVAGSEYTRDVVLGKDVLKYVHTSLLKFRTIVKMFLGSMTKDARTLPLSPVDQIAIVQLEDAMKEISKAYESYEFYKAVAAINRWVTNDLSAFYLETLKDRLYCGDGGGVLEVLWNGMMRMLAPITPILVEESWAERPEWMKQDESLQHPLHQLYNAPLFDHARLPMKDDIRKDIPVLMAVHGAVKAALETGRGNKSLGSSLQSSVVLTILDQGMRDLLEKRYGNEFLEEMFVVSSVEVSTGLPKVEEVAWRYDAEFEIRGAKGIATVLPPRQHKCGRCWRYVAPVEEGLCRRCEEVIQSQGYEI